MAKLIWDLSNVFEEDQHPSRSQVIDWNIAGFMAMKGTNLFLKDKFYLRELARIKKNYPELQIQLGEPTNESPYDKRHFATIEKVVSSHQSTSL